MAINTDQPTATPTNKVAAAGIAGAVVTALVGVLTIFGVVIPPEVSNASLVLVSAVTTIVAFVTAYLKRNKV